MIAHNVQTVRPGSPPGSPAEGARPTEGSTGPSTAAPAPSARTIAAIAGPSSCPRGPPRTSGLPRRPSLGRDRPRTLCPAGPARAPRRTGRTGGRRPAPEATVAKRGLMTRAWEAPAQRTARGAARSEQGARLAPLLPGDHQKRDRGVVSDRELENILRCPVSGHKLRRMTPDEL